ncbi:hypothetical protein OUZ56_017266 [Daphnia magna]|uniref:Uncharacterized protein n=1 Tax=Daphnia magna TaxID=35525 RepID=A0ABR0ASI7_9CRUS|nr:hypothetical protein OUZ56_017266 [Daphnia magna]
MAACRVAGLHEYCFSQRENALFHKNYCNNCEFPLMGIRVVEPVPKPDIITVGAVSQGRGYL